MRVNTFSIVVGNETCDAKCPYCVSAMTPKSDVERDEPINEARFKKAAALARDSGASTAMLTGKGEPTLRVAKISRYLDLVSEAGFPLVELQTNGLSMRGGRVGLKELEDWRDRGLNTVAVSCAGFDGEANRRVFAPYSKTPLELEPVIELLHKAGLSVRLSCVMHADSVRDAAGLDAFVDKARELGVEQTTLVPVNRPEAAADEVVALWVNENRLTRARLDSMLSHLRTEGTMLMRLPHGAEIFDLRGQNVCWSECLTRDLSPDAVRNLIFYDDGKLSWSWEFAGARIF